MFHKHFTKKLKKLILKINEHYKSKKLDNIKLEN